MMYLSGTNYGRSVLTYREYLKLVLPDITERCINNTHWCDLFNNGHCNKRFPNKDVRCCNDCFDDEVGDKYKIKNKTD